MHGIGYDQGMVTCHPRVRRDLEVAPGWFSSRPGSMRPSQLINQPMGVGLPHLSGHIDRGELLFCLRIVRFVNV